MLDVILDPLLLCLVLDTTELPELLRAVLYFEVTPTSPRRLRDDGLYNF
jgi:hypothetical protein